MQTDTIIVQYVNARNGNRPPSIKDTAGNYYTITDDSIGMFQPQTQGELTYTVNEKGFKNAVSWCGQALPKPQRQAPRPVQAQGPRPVAASVPKGNGEDTKAMEIFVTGVIGRCFHGTGNLPDAAMLESMVRSAREGWSRGMRPAAPPPPSGPEDYGQDPNDDIPFEL